MARIIDENKYASAASHDGSCAYGDAGRTECTAYYSLAARTRRAMDREALATVVAALRADAVVLRVVRRVLRVRRSAIKLMLDLANARPAAAGAVHVARTDAAARHSAFRRLTGGACLAAV